uniref:Uncharacterized protein n=1 Tax=Chromera velia CCMP2878 TaxID=1169474 RepID=A0A0G4F2W5_9ALVE|eukprot:Cvel_14976.t1-p1 / transcript=Cvel_14976.t1 / gene=Cvel_14976 / organism=Chromera_velia_CCMP2878 / gene_product=Zinc finger protein 283, putative / transcript_product=Zinc finger protein 283, putative / location=Cvel_scaffold1088:41179-47471(+) / protein_length=375 / sequence_SO=supercontig / SO=protein_coding / is_pseudo=false
MVARGVSARSVEERASANTVAGAVFVKSVGAGAFVSMVAYAFNAKIAVGRVFVNTVDDGVLARSVGEVASVNTAASDTIAKNVEGKACANMVASAHHLSGDGPVSPSPLSQEPSPIESAVQKMLRQTAALQGLLRDGACTVSVRYFSYRGPPLGAISTHKEWKAFVKGPRRGPGSRNIPFQNPKVSGFKQIQHKYPYFKWRTKSRQYICKQHGAVKPILTAAHLHVEYDFPNAPVFWELKETLERALPGVRVTSQPVERGGLRVIRERDDVAVDLAEEIRKDPLLLHSTSGGHKETDATEGGKQKEGTRRESAGARGSQDARRPTHLAHADTGLRGDPREFGDMAEVRHRAVLLAKRVMRDLGLPGHVHRPSILD